MKDKGGRLLAVIVLIGLLGSVWTGPLFAQDAKDMGGWEKDGAYNGYYKMSEADSIKGIVVDLDEVVPLPGMSPGLALTLKDQDGESVTVHVGPLWFVGKPPIRKGDAVKIRGVWAEIEGKEVFMASKVKKEDAYEYKVRLTKDGTPFWTMTEEELARERQSD